MNQDDVSAYHLFYADAVGNAGTEVTFFDWADTPANRPGAGEIAAIGAAGADRARSTGGWPASTTSACRTATIAERGGCGDLPFTDPEGQRLELVADGGPGAASPGDPWPRSPVPEERHIRGLGAATLSVARLEPTATVLTEALGFRRTGSRPWPDDHAVSSSSSRPGRAARGARSAWWSRAGTAPARQGYGGVHHVAFRTPERRSSTRPGSSGRRDGLGIVTPVIDRFYFRSLYFREPGGILFEIATDGPGFATDEDAAHLGEGLALPPFLEPRRAEIEADLQPLTTVAAAR